MYAPSPSERTHVRSSKIKMVALTSLGVMALGGQAAVADAATTKAKSTTKKSAKKKHQTNASVSTSVSDPGSTSVTDPTTGRKCADGHGRHGGRGHGGNETPLSGDTKTQAESAALAAYPDAKVWRSSTEDPNDPSGAAYEVHMTKADGSEIEVLPHKDFKVIATEASNRGPRGGHDGDGDGPGADASADN